MKDYGGDNERGPWTVIKRAAKPHVRTAIYAVHRRLGRFEPRIWLLGEARSGTTWLTALINADRRMLERFEPFHPDYHIRVCDYPKLLYRRPGTPDPVLETVMRDTFAARYWNNWVDQHQRGWVYHGVLVKDVFASLLARWALDHLPPVVPVLAVRNPFAVARSKIAKVGWDWAEDIGALLADEALVADHLAPFVPLLREVAAQGDRFSIHIAMWAAVHHVLQRQFSRDELIVVFFEDAVAQPGRLQAQLRADLGLPALTPAAAWTEAETTRVSSPDSVTRVRSDPFGDWQDGLDAEHKVRGMAILEAFGLAQLYDSEGRPDAARLRFRGDPA